MEAITNCYPTSCTCGTVRLSIQRYTYCTVTRVWYGMGIAHSAHWAPQELPRRIVPCGMANGRAPHRVASHPHSDHSSARGQAFRHGWEHATL